MLNSCDDTLNAHPLLNTANIKWTEFSILKPSNRSSKRQVFLILLQKDKASILDSATEKRT
jgi:hypothetical protein